MVNRSIRRRNIVFHFVVSLIIALTLFFVAKSAFAEYIQGIPIWNGITGMAETFGSRGVGCPSSGVAYSYTHATDNIYYVEVYLKEISTYDYPHVINYAKKMVLL